jgi:hypothetical protein
MNLLIHDIAAAIEREATEIQGAVDDPDSRMSPTHDRYTIAGPSWRGSRVAIGEVESDSNRRT